MIEARRFGLTYDPPARGAPPSASEERIATQCARLGITEDTLICSGCLQQFESAGPRKYCGVCIAKRDINRPNSSPTELEPPKEPKP